MDEKLLKHALEEIAQKTNDALGYELFQDINNADLAQDFVLTSRALTKKALGSED